MTRNCRDSFPTTGARGATDGYSEFHREHGLKLENGGTVRIARTLGHLPVLTVGDASNFVVMDVTEEELRMIAMMLSEAG